MTAGIARIGLACIWFETLLFGVNCVLYGACIFVLSHLRRPSPGRGAHGISYKMICFTCTFIFATAAIHVVLCFLLIMETFTNPETVDTLSRANDYIMSNKFLLPSGIMYILNAIARFLLFIWRLYVVAGHTWKPCITPLILVTANICSAFVATYFLERDGTASHSLQRFAFASWTMAFCLNAGISTGIFYFVWGARRRTQAGGLFSRSSSPYTLAATILFVIESGALIAGCELVMISLNYAESIASIAVVCITIQVTTASLLLLIVRVGIRLTYCTDTKDSIILSSVMPMFETPLSIDADVDAGRSMDNGQFQCMPGTSRTAQDERHEVSLGGMVPPHGVTLEHS